MRTESVFLNEPWVDLPTARCFLHWLVDEHMSPSADPIMVQIADINEAVSVDTAAGWLIQHGLGALAYGRCQAGDSALRRWLQPDMFAAAAEVSLKQAQLQKLVKAYEEAGIFLVVLKGAALSLTVYDDPAWRTMSDIDIWVQDDDMRSAAHVMAALGYHADLKEERPFTLQQLARGEIEFRLPNMTKSLVEIHWSPFPGWWLTRTAVIDELALWARREPLGVDINASQLSPEDMVIHLATHMAINHQFGLSVLRSFIDIALTAQKREVDWLVVAQRAKTWRVRTAVFTSLELLNQFVEVADLDSALQALNPSGIRRWLIRRFVTPEKVLVGRDYLFGWRRFLLLILLVDRVRDMVKLVWRTIWPESAWLTARYGGDLGHWAHLWRVIRYGEV